MNRRYWIVVPVLLGMVLVANPVYLYPDGGGKERTYALEQVENETMAEIAISRSERVVDCPGVRLCAAEERVLGEGSLGYDGHLQSFEEPFTQYEDPGWYPVVRIGNRPYLPEHESRESGTVLRLTELSPMEAVEEAAVPAADQPEAVREAVETGSVTVHGGHVDILERGAILEHRGDYYVTESRTSDSHWTENNLGFLRLLLYGLGGGLLFESGRRFPT